MPGFWPDFDQIFDQIFGQVFDQGFDQGFWSPKYSVQGFWSQKPWENQNLEVEIFESTRNSLTSIKF